MIPIQIQSKKVNFIILGVQKGGTTAAYHYLNQHPNLVGANNKETGFFSMDKKYKRGINYYHSFFKKRILRKTVYYEANPIYFYYHFVPKRLFKYNPDIKFILLLRDPVKRAYSQWNMYRLLRKGDRNAIIKKFAIEANEDYKHRLINILTMPEYPSFDEVVKSEINDFNANIFSKWSILEMGIYVEQLERYLNYYSLDRFYIVESEEFKKEKVEVLNKFCDFLEIKNFNWKNLKNYHQREYLNEMSSKTKRLLKEFYEPYNQRLYNLVGKTFDW